MRGLEGARESMPLEKIDELAKGIIEEFRDEASLKNASEMDRARTKLAPIVASMPFPQFGELFRTHYDNVSKHRVYFYVMAELYLKRRRN